MHPMRVPNHVERGLSLLLSQYKGRPLLTAWTVSYLKQVQLLDDATYATIISRFLERATNAQLDLIGKLVGEPRRDRDDALYRVFIAARIRVNRSTGLTRDIVDVLAIIYGGTYVLIDQAPANLRLELLEIPELATADILEMLRDAKAGGVGLTLVVPTTAPETRFLFKSVGDTSNPAQGCGSSTDVTPTGGLASDVASAH